MRTMARQRFVNMINNTAFVQSAVQTTVARTGHSIRRDIKATDKSAYEEFVVGKSIVGNKNIIRKHKT